MGDFTRSALPILSMDELFFYLTADGNARTGWDTLKLPSLCRPEEDYDYQMACEFAAEAEREARAWDPFDEAGGYDY